MKKIKLNDLLLHTLQYKSKDLNESIKVSAGDEVTIKIIYNILHG